MSMLQIDYLKISQTLRKQGYRHSIFRYIRKAAKNVAQGRPYRITNRPGNIIELPEPGYNPASGKPPVLSKYLVTRKGRLWLI